MKIFHELSLAFVFVIPLVFTAHGLGQDAALQKAAGIKPRQTDVDCDSPSPEQLKTCQLEKSKTVPGFVLYDGSGRILRQFLDVNRDGDLDQWSYYKNGLEVYRDVDANHDKKTDSYRWLGRGGTRWGLDPDQDGKIDSWRIISAEEVAFEVFMAIKARDLERFQRLLLTSRELESLELGSQIGGVVQKRVADASKNFIEFCEQQDQISSDAEWVHAGTGMPSLLAKDTYGNGRDVVVYDQASAVFKTTDYGQLSLGSIVQVGPVWRLIDLPEIVDESKPITNGGALFPLPVMGEALAGTPSAATPQDEKLAQLFEDLAELEKQLGEAEQATDIEKLEERKAQLLEKFFVTSTDPELKQDWLENLADTVASAYQSERFPNGLKFLDGFADRLKAAGYSQGLDYIRWRVIFAEYGLSTELGDRRGRDDAHEQLMKDLENFQLQYKSSPLSADALCQLGIHYEIENEPKKAIDRYREASRRFPETSFGKRATGALKRLDASGKTIAFKGQTLAGQKFDLEDPRWRGKVVVIHFWETWCADGLDEIKKLVEKYKDDVVFIGCNIENDTEDFKAYLEKNRDLTMWTQLHAPGSMENSSLAHQFGVPSEPLIMVFDKQGQLVVADVNVNDLEREIELQRRK